MTQGREWGILTQEMRPGAGGGQVTFPACSGRLCMSSLGPPSPWLSWAAVRGPPTQSRATRKAAPQGRAGKLPAGARGAARRPPAAADLARRAPVVARAGLRPAAPAAAQWAARAGPSRAAAAARVVAPAVLRLNRTPGAAFHPATGAARPSKARTRHARSANRSSTARIPPAGCRSAPRSGRRSTTPS